MSTNRSGKSTRESPQQNTLAASAPFPHPLAPKGRQAERLNTLPANSFEERHPETEHPLNPDRLQRRSSALSEDSQEVQDFSTTIDTYSAADILRQLSYIQELNKNLSYLVSEWKDFNSPSWSFPVSFKRRRELGQCINPDFVQFLSAISLEDERTAMPLLQFAWRAIVSRGVFLILEPYSLAFRTFSGSENWVKPQSNPIIRVANDMRDSPDRAYYANWRSLTYRFVRGTFSGDIEKSVEALSKSITLLLFASISLPRQPGQPSYKKVQKECEEQVAHILKEARVLAGMIQEGVLTREYRPFHPPFGRIVDKEMNVEDSRGLPAPGDEVLCVTQPGLIDDRGKTLAPPSVLTRKTLHKIANMNVPSLSIPHKIGLWLDSTFQRAALPRDPNFNWP